MATMTLPSATTPRADTKSIVPPAVSAEQWDLAQRIHRSMLPRDFRDESVEVAVRCEEHDVLGGDYCSLFKTDDDKLFLCICDVTGHGVAAALLAGRINSFVRQEVTTAGHPCQVVDHLNRFVSSHFSGLGVYASFFCVEIDLRWQGVTYAGAGHPAALLWHNRGAIERLESGLPPIGISADMGQSCRLEKTSVQPGDRLFLFTDGVTETRDSAGRFFGIEGIEAVLRSLPADTESGEALDQILSARCRFSDGEPAADDVLALAARFF